MTTKRLPVIAPLGAALEAALPRSPRNDPRPRGVAPSLPDPVSLAAPECQRASARIGGRADAPWPTLWRFVLDVECGVAPARETHLAVAGALRRIHEGADPTVALGLKRCRGRPAGSINHDPKVELACAVAVARLLRRECGLRREDAIDRFVDELIDAMAAPPASPEERWILHSALRPEVAHAYRRYRRQALALLAVPSCGNAAQ